MLTPQQVADYFLHTVDRDAGDDMTNLRLQKLVYYAQAWHLALLERPLFNEDFQAWMHGPVLPGLFHQYKAYGYRPIEGPSGPMPDIPSDTREVLDEVWDAYGQFSATYLENLTHQEDPWIDARGDCEPGDRCTTVIPKAAMQEYYASRAVSV